MSAWSDTFDFYLLLFIGSVIIKAKSLTTRGACTPPRKKYNIVKINQGDDLILRQISLEGFMNRESKFFVKKSRNQKTYGTLFLPQLDIFAWKLHIPIKRNLYKRFTKTLKQYMSCPVYWTSTNYP
ncbi:hypothetical protein ROZALSC1DRAFT_25644 [Rozella allomycis CSF55]|uniref:Uncharacterized protein n=1 Tax=Rozella allomycis (strain CSF55) TaxID=988480 RepID=A0A4V1IYX9_ROZAC|nr:hypothetical protein ROZALSC1DRAFT_25644 [Rozella allomycis CSF55]